MNQPVRINQKTDEFLEDERRLIERAKNYPLAFGELFDRYYDSVYHYILHRTAHVELASDLTSDTFFVALKKLWMFRWRNVPFSAWLFRIATNKVNGYYRKHKHTVGIEVFAESLTDENDSSDFRLLQSESELKQKTDFLALHRSIRLLKIKYQTVIVLRFFEDKSIDEISAILGKPEGTVKSLIHRALQQLRDGMDIEES